MLQGGEQEGFISRTQWDDYLDSACRKLGTNTSIISRKYNVDPFQTIRNMSNDKKQFTKNFLLGIMQVVPNSEKAKYYFIST